MGLPLFAITAPQPGHAHRRAPEKGERNPGFRSRIERSAA
jgi:hypothetical protein